jgi:PHD/YefM family antitoxin component YafN of YafNO toxin-antitoxin module
MTITLKSSAAQQSFGHLMDQALSGNDVVVERYGAPRIAVINYSRYQRLLDAERELLRLQLQQASDAVTARAAHFSDEEINQLIEDARNEVYAESQRNVARGH